MGGWTDGWMGRWFSVWMDRWMNCVQQLGDSEEEECIEDPKMHGGPCDLANCCIPNLQFPLQMGKCVTKQQHVHYIAHINA